MNYNNILKITVMKKMYFLFLLAMLYFPISTNAKTINILKTNGTKINVPQYEANDLLRIDGFLEVDDWMVLRDLNKEFQLYLYQDHDIPDEALKYSKVTSITIVVWKKIGNSAFQGCFYLNSVSITGKQNIIIGNSAFSGCSLLTNVALPEQLVSIGESAFSYCESLVSINIPNNVTNIGKSIFSHCKNLTSIIVPFVGLTPDKGSMADWYSLFQDSKPTKKLKITISSPSCKEIRGYAFEGFSTISEVNLPNSIISIGRQAFKGCSGLVTINIPNNVANIGYEAFKDCSSLSSIINIPDKVTIIESSVFENCSSLTSVVIPQSVDSMGYWAFKDCQNLNFITFKNSNNFRFIGSDAFKNTAWFNNQPNGPIYIGKILHKYKGTMPPNTTIQVKDGTIKISQHAFENCENLYSVIIPSSVVVSTSDIFVDCSNLAELTIPHSRVWSYFYPANPPNSLKKVTITAPCQIIENSAFGNNKIEEIILPNTLTDIKDYAFNNCFSLRVINLPDKLTKIGGYAFNNCTLLNDIYAESNSPATISDNNTFNGVDKNICKIHVPCAGKRDYEKTFGWCDFKNIIGILKPEEPVVNVGAAGLISGASVVHQKDENITYSVSAIENATSYIWELPTGATGTSMTNSITVSFGDNATNSNISVKGINACFEGESSSLSITVHPPLIKDNIFISSSYNNTYNGREQMPSVYTGSGRTPIMEYKKENADDNTYTTATPFNAGNYIVRASLPQSETYSSANGMGNFTIRPLSISVWANGGSSTYGDSPINSGLKASGLVNGETEEVLTGLSNDFEINSKTPVGIYEINVIGVLSNANYTINSRYPGSWFVTRKKIEITANGGSSTYGDNPANPGFKATGLVNGDTEEVLTGVSCSFYVDEKSYPGTYRVDVIALLPNGSNYEISYSKIHYSIWTVYPKEITVTADNLTKKIGDPDPVFTYTIEPALINGDQMWGWLTRDYGEDVGSYVIGQGTLERTNYSITYIPGTLTIVNPSSINEISKEDSASLSLYPNPVKAGTLLTINVNCFGEQDVNVLLYNMAGNLIDKQILSIIDEKIQIVAPLQSGVYFVKIVSKEFNKQGKFIVE